jgi:hypothetical protein
MFRIEIDDHEAVEAIDKLLDTVKLREDLEDVLDRQYARAQSLVHVHTSKLRESGAKSTDWNPVDRQHGRVHRRRCGSGEQGQRSGDSACGLEHGANARPAAAGHWQTGHGHPEDGEGVHDHGDADREARGPTEGGSRQGDSSRSFGTSSRGEEGNAAGDGGACQYTGIRFPS